MISRTIRSDRRRWNSCSLDLPVSNEDREKLTSKLALDFAKKKKNNKRINDEKAFSKKYTISNCVIDLGLHREATQTQDAKPTVPMIIIHDSNLTHGFIKLLCENLCRIVLNL